MERKIISISKASYKHDYVIELLFSDGKKRVIDFSSFLLSAKNPMTKKYLDTQRFKEFQLQQGDLLWGDFEMCFPVWDLYRGKL